MWDAGWRLRFVSREYATITSAGRAPEGQDGIGEHFLSRRMMEVREAQPAGPTTDSFLATLREMGPYILHHTEGGLDGVRPALDPRLLPLLEGVTPRPAPAAWATRVDVKFGVRTIGNDVLIVRLNGPDGAVAGFGVLAKPEMRATVLGMLALGDARLFERMSGLVTPARRPAAVLFADLENSTPLAKRLSTPAYFTLIRRIASGSDRAVVDAHGIVGKHVGDGVTAFFLAEDAGSESAAARGCIESMQAIRRVARTAAERSGLHHADVTIRFGLHWGGTLYVGRLMTSGRAEITALGDEVNEGARIEACASGGLALASKALLERLDPADAAALGIDPDQLGYTPLTDLPTATEKARRDAPSIAVSAI